METGSSATSSGSLDWCVAIFARNERSRIAKCLEALKPALRGYSAHVVLIINGSTDGTPNAAVDLVSGLGISASVYTVAYGCKSHAMNLFIEQLRVPAKYSLFLDATSFVEEAALRELEKALIQNPEKVAVSGLPRNGRDASRMREDARKTPRLFGQMFAVRSEFLDYIVSLGRRLPVGLYRGDGLFCGFICWETDGISHEYAVPRIATVPTAYWRIEPVSWFSLNDVKVGFNRLVRQARGRLENQAWNSIVWSKGFGSLPQFADDMILVWLKTGQPRKESLFDKIFTTVAMRKVAAWKKPDPAALLPTRHL